MFTPRHTLTEYDCNLLNKNIKIGDGCWTWAGSHSSGGYPCMHKGNGYGKSTTVSRILCEYEFGPVTDKVWVAMHSCNNPRCVNPSHLSWGTQSRNIKQAYKDGNRKTIPEYVKLKQERT